MRSRRKAANQGQLFDNDKGADGTGPSEAEGLASWERIQAIDAQLARHVALESEMKSLKSQIRVVGLGNFHGKPTTLPTHEHLGQMFYTLAIQPLVP